MSSVLRFFKRRIKPFRRCHTNPSTQVSFEQGTVTTTTTTITKNSYKLRHDNNIPADARKVNQTAIFHDEIAGYDGYDGYDDNQFYTSPTLGESSCPSKFAISSIVDSTTCAPSINTPNSDFQTFTSYFDDGLQAKSGTPLSAHNYQDDSDGYKLPIALTFDASSSDAPVDTILTEKNDSATNTYKRRAKMMNGTYTIGNKMRLKNNSIRAATKVLLKQKRKSSENKKGSETRTIESFDQQEETGQHQSTDQSESKINEPSSETNIKIEVNNTQTSDSLCDPLFSSTLKSSVSTICDDSSIKMQKDAKSFENPMTTITVAKTAHRRCLVENKNFNTSSKLAVQDIVNPNEMHETFLCNNSVEKMRRSISFPAINDQISPIVGNVSRISAIKDVEEIEILSSITDKQGIGTPILKAKERNIVNDTFEKNDSKQDLTKRDETTSNTNIEFKEPLQPSESQNELSVSKSSKNAKRLSRSTSLLNNSSFTFEEFANEDNSNCQNQFVRGGEEKLRMSKTIKQMFKNVVKYQMNALNCLEKFYEAQVLKLETDRRRNLALNPENREFITKFYDTQLALLEQRVYSNLTFICRNKCTGCSFNNTANSNASTMKISKMAHLIVQHQQKHRQPCHIEESLEHDSNCEKLDTPRSSNFKRQLSLPFQSRSPQQHIQNIVETINRTNNEHETSNKISNETPQNSMPLKTKYKKQSNNNSTASSSQTSARKVQKNKDGAKSALQNSVSTCRLGIITNLAVDKVKRQIKSASSLQEVDNSERPNESNLKRQNQILTNGSLAMAIQHGNVIGNSSNLFLNAENEFSSFQQYPSSRVSDSFQQLKFAEKLISANQTSSPTSSRRHTCGSDKHFKKLVTKLDESEIIKRKKQQMSLKETQV